MLTLKTFNQRLFGISMGGALVLLSACSADTSKIPLIGSSTKAAIPSDPVVTSFVYAESSGNVTVNPPYYTTKTIAPVFGTGLCSSSPTLAQVIFNGTYDNTNGKTFVVTGASSHSTSTVGTVFQVTACMAIGSSTVHFSTLNANNVANANPVVVSIQIPNPNPTLNLTTIGSGHPKYPSTGFQTLAGSASALIRGVPSGTASNTLVNFSMGDKGTQTVNSTGNTAYTLQVGYVNMIKNASP